MFESEVQKDSTPFRTAQSFALLSPHRERIFKEKTASKRVKSRAKKVEAFVFIKGTGIFEPANINIDQMAQKLFLIREDEYKRLKANVGATNLDKEEDIGINTDLKEQILSGAHERFPSKIWYLTVQSVPKRAQRSCEAILLLFASDPKFAVNSKQEVILNGERWQNSSIIELVDTLLRVQVSNPDPTHWDTFTTYLRKIHIPRNLIKNSYRAEEIYSKDAEPSVETDDEADGIVIPGKRKRISFKDLLSV